VRNCGSAGATLDSTWLTGSTVRPLDSSSPAAVPATPARAIAPPARSSSRRVNREPAPPALLCDALTTSTDATMSL